MGAIREAVREHYAQAARHAVDTGSCCSGAGCSCTCGAVLEGSDIDLAMPLSLGSGLPVKLARLRPGEVVLDLGSGAGLDALVAAGQVGADGRVYGVDFTDEMLALAEANKKRAGIANVEFIKASIDDVPLPARSVDVVISNCVINLADDKGAVLRDAFRVLRPGGRLAVADMVALEEPSGGAPDPVSWAACIAGAITPARYERLLTDAGFVDVAIEPDGDTGRVTNAHVRARKPA